MNNVLQNEVYDHTTGTKVNSRHFSSEITMQIKPNDQWGSCHTEHDEGTVRSSIISTNSISPRACILKCTGMMLLRNTTLSTLQ